MTPSFCSVNNTTLAFMHRVSASLAALPSGRSGRLSQQSTAQKGIMYRPGVGAALLKGSTVLSLASVVHSGLTSMIETVHFVQLVESNKCIKNNLDRISLSA